MGLGAGGLGLGVWGVGFGVWGSGLGVGGSGFRVRGVGVGVQGSGFRVQGSGIWCGVHHIARRILPPPRRVLLHVLAHLVCVSISYPATGAETNTTCRAVHPSGCARCGAGTRV